MGKYGPFLDEPVRTQTRGTEPSEEPATTTPATAAPESAPTTPVAPASAVKQPAPVIVQDAYAAVPPKTPQQVWDEQGRVRTYASALLVGGAQKIDSVAIPKGKKHEMSRYFRDSFSTCLYGEAAELVSSRPAADMTQLVVEMPNDPFALAKKIFVACGTDTCETAFMNEPAYKSACLANLSE